MGEVTIFTDQGAVARADKREPTELGKTLASSGLTTRRIQTNTNGTFKRLVNGEQVGDAVRGDMDVIIVGALPEVSRIFYAKKYDPDAEPTLPDCWSNLGDVPEKEAKNKQHANCAECPKNVKGSGGGTRRACRYQRRISVMLVGDEAGEVYQFNVPAMSLFGKGQGNVHPFESYVRYLLANNESPDTVVTNISYDLNADTMTLLFSPLRGISAEEDALVRAAQARPETKRYTKLTVAQADKVTEQPEAEAKEEPAPKISHSAEPDDDAPIEEPKKRGRKKKADAPEVKKALAEVVDEWGAD